MISSVEPGARVADGRGFCIVTVAVSFPGAVALMTSPDDLVPASTASSACPARSGVTRCCPVVGALRAVWQTGRVHGWWADAGGQVPRLPSYRCRDGGQGLSVVGTVSVKDLEFLVKKGGAPVL